MIWPWDIYCARSFFDLRADWRGYNDELARDDYVFALRCSKSATRATERRSAIWTQTTTDIP